MMKFLFLFSILAVLMSCSDLEKEQQLRRIRQEQKTLENLTKKLEDPRLLEVSTFKVNTMQTELKIKQNLYLDTINLELAQQLDAFKVMRRSIKPLMQQYHKIKTGIVEEKSALKLLYQDIQQGRGARHRYNEFIEFEHHKVQQIAALTKDFERAKKQLFKDYNRLYPPVNELANQLVAKAARRQ
jgi:hypothetical protein